MIEGVASESARVMPLLGAEQSHCVGKENVSKLLMCDLSF